MRIEIGASEVLRSAPYYGIIMYSRRSAPPQQLRSQEYLLHVYWLLFSSCMDHVIGVCIRIIEAVVTKSWRPSGTSYCAEPLCAIGSE